MVVKGQKVPSLITPTMGINEKFRRSIRKDKEINHRKMQVINKNE